MRETTDPADRVHQVDRAHRAYRTHGALSSHRMQSIYMDTTVAIEIVSAPTVDEREIGQKLEMAMHAFYEVEQACSRFDPDSEVMRLLHRVGEPTPVSPILFESLRFALAVAEMTGGRFDPTIGRRLEMLGFNRHYLSGETQETSIAPVDVTYRDIQLDEENRCVTLLRPIVIDLGAVAKGLAIDFAAQQFQDCEGFAIDAGGDVFVGGERPEGGPWRIGIRHPRQKGEHLHVLQVSDMAVCTSGDYERRSPVQPELHHILQTGSARDVQIGPTTDCKPDEPKDEKNIVSASVIAPFAMMADALSTAAFVLGGEAGIELLQGCEVEGVIVADDGTEYRTENLEAYLLDA